MTSVIVVDKDKTSLEKIVHFIQKMKTSKKKPIQKQHIYFRHLV